MMDVNKNALRDGLMAVASKYSSSDSDDYMWRCEAVLMGAHAPRMVGLISSLRDADDKSVFREVSDSLESANRFIEDGEFRLQLMERVFEQHNKAIDDGYLDAWQFWAGAAEKHTTEQLMVWAAVWAQMQHEVRAYLATLH